MISPYLGKIEYCYSNSTAMLLRSIGERIDPSLIEVMTGMGISEVDEIAGVSSFLAGHDSSYINSQSIVVDGGKIIADIHEF